MKITNATTFLELQTFLRDEEVSLSLDYVGSANAFRAQLRGYESDGKPFTIISIGREIGEATQSSITKLKTHRGGA